MSSRRLAIWPLATVLLGVLALFIALPQEWKTWAPGFLTRPGLHLGIDLAGGTQLDFRISEEEIRAQREQVDKDIERLENGGGTPEELDLALAQRLSIVDQQANLVEAIRTVLERRINSLGVSEATITPSYVGDEKHLLVECPGVIDIQECIDVVGKTIQLEFKEEFTEATDDYKEEVRSKARATLRRITESGSNLVREGEDLGNQLGMGYQPSQQFFRDQLPKGLEDMWTMQPGRVVLREGSVLQARQQANGQFAEVEVPGVFLAEVLRTQTATGRTIQEAAAAFAFLQRSEPNLRHVHHENASLAGVDARVIAALKSIQPGSLKQVQTDETARVLFLNSLTPGGEQVNASHILVSYEEAAAAEPTVTRTKQAALARANQLKSQLDAGANFETLARTQSDGESRAQAGRLDPFGRNTLPRGFEQFAQTAFSIKEGEIAGPIETPYGYHIIRLDKAPSVTPDRATYDELIVSGADAMSRADDIAGRLSRGEVRTIEPAVTLRILFFSLEPTGWKDTPLDGKNFRTAVVSQSATSLPLVQIVFDGEGATMFQELTRKNIGKKIAIFVGGELVSEPTVQQEIAGGVAVITGSESYEEARKLAQDLNTGAIPAPIYLVGQYTIEATLGDAALRTSLIAALVGTLILMVFMVLMYRVLGLVADIALLFYAILLFALFKLPLFLVSNSYVVLTLAGMAGIILSIGMAVDANVLVFERMKEELRKGKLVKTAIESSFKHSWPAIRDGNVAALITCAILFAVGTSIVRGFAVTLGIGVTLSVFTAVTVTRWLLRQVAKTELANRPELFGVKKSELKIMNNE